MPAEPSGCELMKETSCRRGSTFGSMRYWMFGRSKLATKCRASGSRRRSVDLAVGRGRRRRGERHARNARESLGEVAEREVVGPEVVTPLRHAVGFVDRDDAERAALQERCGLRRSTDARERHRAGRARPRGTPARPRAARRRLGRVEVGGAHAVGDERVDLVVHEGDERADDEPRARAHERRHLVRDALAATGRHQHDCVAAADHLLDDLRPGRRGTRRSRRPRAAPRARWGTCSAWPCARPERTGAISGRPS